MAEAPNDRLEVIRDDGEVVKVTRAMWESTLNGTPGWSLKPKAKPKSSGGKRGSRTKAAPAPAAEPEEDVAED